MSTSPKPRRKRSPKDPAPERAAEMAARQELGIELLGDDEELIDDATFAKMHERLAIHLAPEVGTDTEDDDGAGIEELDELLLEEIATELPRDRGDEQSAPAAIAAPPNSPAEVAALEALIRGAENRDDVARLAV
jgi:hypothetical protein